MYYRSPCLFFRNIVWSMSSCFRARQDHYGARGLWPDHPCARGLARPLRALGPSGTRQTTPCSGTSGQTTSCSGTASITLRPQLGDFVARFSTYAWGLPRPLSNHGSGILRLDYMRLVTRIQLGYFFSLRPCYKAHTSPSSKLGDYIGTMHLPVYLVSLVR